MAKEIISQSTSIFDGIRHLDEHSQEYRLARDYAHKIGFDESYFFSISNVEKKVYLLNLSVRIAQDTRYTAGKEAFWICLCTLMIPCKVSSEALFNATLSVINDSLQERRDESYLHQVFRKHFKKWLPGYELVVRGNNPKHIPDFWLLAKESQCLTPVEIKAHPFDSSAVKQLKRYLKEYRCQQGIAVAPSCKVQLPQNIQFVVLNKAILDDLHQESVAFEDLKSYFHAQVVNGINADAEKELARLTWEIEMRKMQSDLLSRQMLLGE